jgi:hypothetical protein
MLNPHHSAGRHRLGAQDWPGISPHEVALRWFQEDALRKTIGTVVTPTSGFTEISGALTSSA